MLYLLSLKLVECMSIASLKTSVKCGSVLLSGNQEWDGHTGAWSGTITAVTSTWQDYPACAFKGSQDTGHWTRPRLHRQRPVYVQTVSSKNPNG